MESIISTFHIDWKIIIAQAINFGVVFVVLYIYALKPLSKLMAERSSKIGQGIADAKENAALLAKSQTEYEKALSKARSEADTIFKAGKKEAEAKKAEMLEEARGEVKSMIESGKMMMAAEKVKMVDEAKKEIVALSMQAVEKLLGSNQDLNNL